MHNPVPIITPEEQRLKDVVLSIRELKAAKIKLTGAKFYCAHAGGLQAMEGHLQKLCKDVGDMINFLDKIYKASPILYNDIRRLYDSLETVVEENQ